MRHCKPLSCLLFLILTVAIPGCQTLAEYIVLCTINYDCNPIPCVVGDTLVQVRDGSIPPIPDQAFTSECINVSIVRTFENDAEQELIQQAEGLASTVGSTWYMVPDYLSPSDPFPLDDSQLLTPDAVNSEALSYYAKRTLSFQTSQNSANARTRIDLTYTARVIQLDRLGPQGPIHGFTVQLVLGYSQWYGPLAATSFSAMREVDFDESGQIVEIRGDGEVEVAVS
jgi:hypothetical protein